MRTLYATLTALALVLCATATTSRATGAIYAHADVPAQTGGYAEVPYGGFYVAGWALDCTTGLHPQAAMVHAARLTLVKAGEAARWVPSRVTVVPVARPDVAAVLRPYCPGIGPVTGYHLYADPPLPRGTWQVWVVWATYDGAHARQSLTVVVQ